MIIIFLFLKNYYYRNAFFYEKLSFSKDSISTYTFISCIMSILLIMMKCISNNTYKY